MFSHYLEVIKVLQPKYFVMENVKGILTKEKGKIKELILCKDNEKDIKEIKDNYLKGLKFHYVTDMSEVINIAVTKQKVKNAKIL